MCVCRILFNKRLKKKIEEQQQYALQATDKQTDKHKNRWTSRKGKNTAFAAGA